MKKTFAFLGITLLVSMLILVACGGKSNLMTDAQISERLQYRQYTPSNEIVEGNATAIQTINKFLNKEVVIDKDYNTSTMESSFTNVDNDVCMRYEVSKYDTNMRIFYLYKDDTHIVEAIPSDKTYVNGDSLSTSFKKNDNYNGEAFAWVYDGKATCVLDQSAGPRCTSIWAYDESANSIRLVWCDSFNCPIWVNYYNS